MPLSHCRPLPPLALVVTIVLFSFGGPTPACALPPASDYFQKLPDTHPYKPALTRYLGLAPEQKQALVNWASPSPDSAPAPLPAEHLALARTLAAELVAAARSTPSSADLWPLRPNPDDPENPAATLIPEVGTLRELARLAVKVAEDSPPADSIAIYTATARLARTQRQSSSAIQHLTGVAIEGMAVQSAAQRLLDYSPSELSRLAADWPTPDSVPSLDHSLSTERDSFFIPLLQKTIIPGVKARLSLPAGSELPTSVAHLRLSGLIDDGAQKSISLENLATGEFFTVHQDRPEQNIELLDFDLPSRRALIRAHGHDAYIDLQTRQITTLPSPLDRLDTLLDSFTFTAVGLPAPEIDGWLARIRAHPGGPDAYFAELLVRYDELTRAQLEAARRPLAPDPSSFPPEQDFVLKNFMPSFERLARSLNSADTATRMLQAAIHHRLGQLGLSTDPFAAFDPWTETQMTPFAFEPSPEGGFLLRSRYERRPGQPVTYKFAAPDAGLVSPAP